LRDVSAGVGIDRIAGSLGGSVRMPAWLQENDPEGVAFDYEVLE
jgi:hypothetical protein